MCRDSDFWPRNSGSCRDYNKDCEFMDVCKASPELADHILADETLYVPNEWDPFPKEGVYA
jgi:hypothetical protein